MPTTRARRAAIAVVLARGRRGAGANAPRDDRALVFERLFPLVQHALTPISNAVPFALFDPLWIERSRGRLHGRIDGSVSVHSPAAFGG